MTALPLILSIHVDREPTVDKLDLAFARLGGFLDAETETLDALGEALSLPTVGQSVRALQILHRGGGDPDAKVIATAIRHLSDLRDELLVVPNGASVMTPQALQGVFAIKDVDAAVRFIGARIDDQIAALLYTLDHK
jgi:hypothetical protein